MKRENNKQKGTAKDNQRANAIHISKKKMILFRTLTLLLIILFFVVIELMFRLFDYGRDLSLFVESKRDTSCWQMNSFVSDKYFLDKENATVGNIEPFKKHKTNDIFRIFVLGESTTIGFPYLHNGSFHRWLKYRLMFSFPEKNFEIINVSLTAVNSYTVYDFAKQIVDYQPDAVLIYVGHNEYYGALGVGSTSKLGNHPAIVRGLIALNDYRSFQFLSNSVNSFKRAISRKAIDTANSLMVRMPGDKNIQFGSKKYYQGISQFSDNIDKTLALLSEHEIPVLISNLVSNEKDLMPFISDESVNDHSAIYQFNMAAGYYQKGDYKTAKEHFVKAKELDLLRFRAPEALNNEITKLSDRYPNVYLVDAKSYFEQASPHGIIGQETMLEHVHPNLKGYSLLSKAFFDVMAKNRLISDNWNDAMTFGELMDQMPITAIDSLVGDVRIVFMKNSWPYTNNPVAIEILLQPKNEVERLAIDLVYDKISWSQAMHKLEGLYIEAKDEKRASKVSEAIALEYPEKEQYLKSSASFCLRLKDKKKAIFYIDKCFRLNQSYNAAEQLAQLSLESDWPEKAIGYLIYMNSSGTKTANIEPVIEITKGLIKLKESLQSNTTSIDVINMITLNYLKAGQFAVARHYNMKAFALDGKNKNALILKSKIDLFYNSAIAR